MREVELETLRKAVNCGTEENGYKTLYCVDCRKVHKINFSCKTRLCARCGARANELFAEKFIRRMLPVTHRHITFTIPDQLWKMFHNDIELLHALSRAVNRTVVETMEMYLHRKVVPGIMTVVHMFGRDLKENCHVHAIVSEGGVDKKGIWHRFTYFPFVKKGRTHTTMNEVWRDNVLELLGKHLRGTLTGPPLVDHLRKKYIKGFYVHGPVENRIKDNRSLRKKAKYITRYVKHPVIADSRISRYDGKEVEFWYQRPSTGTKYFVVLPVMEFVGAVLKHVPEKHFRAVMYYGLYSPNYPQKVRFQTVFDIEGNAVDPLSLTWREWSYLRTGVDPIRCRTCGREMILVAAIYLKNGDLIQCSYLSVEDRMAIGYP